MRRSAWMAVLPMALLVLVAPAGAMAPGGPHDVHGPGQGYYRSLGHKPCPEGLVCDYEGEVWLHYDQFGCPFGPYATDDWELGVAGIEHYDYYQASHKGIPGTYSWGMVATERLVQGTRLILRGTFFEGQGLTPLAGRPFTFQVDLVPGEEVNGPNLGQWSLFGPGFRFAGTIEGINAHAGVPGVPEGCDVGLWP